MIANLWAANKFNIKKKILFKLETNYLANNALGGLQDFAQSYIKTTTFNTQNTHTK